MKTIEQLVDDIKATTEEAFDLATQSGTWKWVEALKCLVRIGPRIDAVDLQLRRAGWTLYPDVADPPSSLTSYRNTRFSNHKVGTYGAQPAIVLTEGYDFEKELTYARLAGWDVVKIDEATRSVTLWPPMYYVLPPHQAAVVLTHSGSIIRAPTNTPYTLTEWLERHYYRKGGMAKLKPSGPDDTVWVGPTFHLSDQKTTPPDVWAVVCNILKTY